MVKVKNPGFRGAGGWLKPDYHSFGLPLGGVMKKLSPAYSMK